MGRVMLFVGLVCLASVARAGEPTDRTVVIQAVTTIDFTAVDVQAKIERPAIKYLAVRPESTFKSLVRLRDDFDHEVRLSVDEVK